MAKKQKKRNFFGHNFFSKNSRGTILVENIIFIVLNLIFLTALVVFLISQGSGAIVLEQTYAKQIAMLVDSAQPVMLIKIDMEKAKKLAEKNGIDFKNIVTINGNVVRVKLSEKGGYSYAFFNDVDAVPYPETGDSGMYVITINEKGAENE